MQCDDCDSPLNIGQREYADRKENLGVVLCYACRNGSSEDQLKSEPLF